ncbi:MAG: LuxR C-terminal-related transcriptional regulator [Microbacterium sp.]|uniref:helix-turn-helix transcriptional regulator n=1 Tax=Microbacterium sp. TaxID=51671 RepID=UPI0039E3D8EB
MLRALLDDGWIVEDAVVAAYARGVDALPDDAAKAAVRAVLTVLTRRGAGIPAALETIGALGREEPAAAASASAAIAAMFAERGWWAEAQAFVDLALSGVSRLRADGVDLEAAAALWFMAMAVAVQVEWNTFAGSAVFDAVAAALVEPRAKNLLRRHHAQALLALGWVLAGRGEVGAAAVSIARGGRLLNRRGAAGAAALLALARYRQGDWQGAARAAEIVHRAATEAADGSLTALAAAVDALDSALRGDLARTQEGVVRAERELAARPSVLGDAILLHARIALTVGASDWNGMLQLLDSAEEPGYRRIYTPHEWNALRAMAYRNSGRSGRHRALLAEWETLPGAQENPYYWAHRAMLAHVDDDATAAIAAARRARDAIGDGDDPLGRGWTRIVVGTIVSLFADPTEGMESYETARAEFARLGAAGFVALCSGIIQATAAQLARATGDGMRALTPQQRRIAELVADGYTSAEIGEILYLSKKTIDFHAANIVSRLGIRHRREIKRFVDASRAASEEAGPR